MTPSVTFCCRHSRNASRFNFSFSRFSFSRSRISASATFRSSLTRSWKLCRRSLSSIASKRGSRCSSNIGRISTQRVLWVISGNSFRNAMYASKRSRRDARFSSSSLRASSCTKSLKSSSRSRSSSSAVYRSSSERRCCASRHRVFMSMVVSWASILRKLSRALFKLSRRSSFSSFMRRVCHSAKNCFFWPMVLSASQRGSWLHSRLTSFHFEVDEISMSSSSEVNAATLSSWLLKTSGSAGVSTTGCARFRRGGSTVVVAAEGGTAAAAGGGSPAPPAAGAPAPGATDAADDDAPPSMAATCALYAVSSAGSVQTELTPSL
mmetsp:Transcript_33071/g.76493  ORF Transcript_33071/g.76493 Transcript_33071/m.76493 type:complete len:322 (-) Transcript_33071:10-975(-)